LAGPGPQAHGAVHLPAGANHTADPGLPLPRPLRAAWSKPGSAASTERLGGLTNVARSLQRLALSASGFNQLQDLRATACQPTLAVQSLKNQSRRFGDIAGFGSGPCTTIKLSLLLFKTLSIAAGGSITTQ